MIGENPAIQVKGLAKHFGKVKAVADEIVQKLKMISEHKNGLFIMDLALNERKAGD